MRQLISSFLFLFFPSFLFGQTLKTESDSAHGYKYTFVKGDPINARTYVLKNGLTVMMSMNKTSPRVYTCIAVRAGSKNDPKDATGLAHYLEHMLFKGTDKFGTLDFEKEKKYLDQIDSLYVKYGNTKDPFKRKAIYKEIDQVSGDAAKYAIANEYDKMLQHIGAKGTNAYTSFDETVYINDIPSNRIKDWVTIESERFRNPVLRLFHTELEAVYEEKNISLDSDGDKVFESLFKSLFKHHTYGTQTTIGTIEHLKNPSLQKIRDFYSTWYVPNNMIISIAGNFDPEETLALIEDSFGNFPVKSIPTQTVKPEKSLNKPDEISVYGPESPSVTIGFRLPAANSKEASLMRVTDMLLSNSSAGIFDLNLVKKQKVLSASAGVYNLHDYSVLFLEGKPKTGQTLEEVKQLLLAQLDSLKTGTIDPKTLKAIILNKEVDEMSGNENNSSRAFKMLNSFIQQRNWIDVVAESEYMQKVSVSEIQNFAKTWLNTDYSLVYKREGIDSVVSKIEKPEITPVEVNRNKLSHFTKDILDNEAKPLKPQFLDFEKDFTRTSIKPGIQLLSVKNKENSLFSLYYVFEFGRFSNLKLPEAVNLLQFSGTNKLDAEQIAKEFYSMACSFNVYAGNDQVYVSLSGPQEKFERAISTLEHLLENVQPDQAALDLMISNELQERLDAKQSKYAIRNALSNYARFGKKNPQTWQLSSKKLKKLKASDLTKEINSLTGYPHTILYYGSLDSASLKQYVDKYHKTPEVLNPLPKSQVFVPIENNDRKVFFTHYDMVQAEIGWIRNAGVYTPIEQPSIALFNEYFGGGMSSVVFQTIRESKALAYSSYAFYSRPSNLNQPNMAGAYIGTQSDKLDSAIYAMDDLLKTMPQSELLFNGSKSALISQLESDRIQKENIMFNYLASKRLGIDYDIRKDVYNKIPNMNLSEVNAFHQTHFSGKPFNLYIVGSSDRIPKSKLEKYGKVKTLSLKEIFGY
jgi:predicted Zn-dependent peptidase